MKIVNIHNEKTHLSELIKAAENDEEIIICKADKLIVKERRKPGYWEKRVVIKEDFDNLPDDFMEFF